MYTYSFNIFLTGYPELKFASVVLRAKKASKNYKEIIITDYYDDGSEQRYTSIDELFQKNKDITPDNCIFYPIPDLREWYEDGFIENYVYKEEPWSNIMVEFFQKNKNISHATCFFYWIKDQRPAYLSQWGTFFSPDDLYWELAHPDIWYNCTLETDDPDFEWTWTVSDDEEEDTDIIEPHVVLPPEKYY